jgi:hypothetical protein
LATAPAYTKQVAAEQEKAQCKTPSRDLVAAPGIGTAKVDEDGTEEQLWLKVAAPGIGTAEEDEGRTKEQPLQKAHGPLPKKRALAFRRDLGFK